MTDADGIVFAVPLEQVADKGGFGIAFHYSGGKAAVRRFHIPVAVVDTDNVHFIKFSHNFISPFLTSICCAF